MQIDRRWQHIRRATKHLQERMLEAAELQNLLKVETGHFRKDIWNRRDREHHRKNDGNGHFGNSKNLF